jgi:hypothetical protein
MAVAGAIFLLDMGFSQAGKTKEIQVINQG